MEIRLHAGAGNPLNEGVENDGGRAAVIPCRNEVATIGPIVRAVAPFVRTVFVVDDGSRDGTARMAAEAGAVVIRHPRNRGKGAALRSGLAEAAKTGHGTAVLMDGDGQHEPGAIPELFRALEMADLVIGNRFEGSGEMPIIRRWVNRWMSRRMAARLGIDIPDSQCGFRAVRMEAWVGEKWEADHFEIESEMLARFARAGKRIRFVPIRSLPANRPSRIRPLTDSVRWICWWSRMG